MLCATSETGVEAVRVRLPWAPSVSLLTVPSGSFVDVLCFGVWVSVAFQF